MNESDEVGAGEDTYYIWDDPNEGIHTIGSAECDHEGSDPNVLNSEA